MVFVLLLLLFLCLYRIQISGSGFFKDYLTIDKTNGIKGLFVMMVFIRHYNSYVSLSGTLDRPFVLLDKSLGQLIVTCFLFYSGYGVLESIKARGRLSENSDDLIQ